jgi:hypothetical protein
MNIRKDGREISLSTKEMSTYKKKNGFLFGITKKEEYLVLFYIKKINLINYIYFELKKKLKFKLNLVNL